jgi:glutamyl-tRNA reductase
MEPKCEVPIQVVGAGYPRTSIRTLERLVREGSDVYRRLRHAGIDDAVVLSTCQRLEIYGASPHAPAHAGLPSLERIVEPATEGPPASDLFELSGSAAVEHLFSVAAGIESILPGEPQILTQVREALERGEAERMAGPALRRLFHAALRAGRRVRREAGIGLAHDAVVQAAIDLAMDLPGHARPQVTAVVGAGRMARIAVQHLARLGLNVRTVLDRTPERASDLAARVGATAGPLTDMDRLLHEADLVVMATSAADPLITAGMAVGDARPAGSPLLLVDLGMPRNVDPQVAKRDGVRLVGLEQLRGIDGGVPSLGLRSARRIVRDEVRRYAIRLQEDRAGTAVAALYDRGAAIRRLELGRIASVLRTLPLQDREAVEALAYRIVAKLLHPTAVGLKRVLAGEEPEAVRTALMLAGLTDRVEMDGSGWAAHAAVDTDGNGRRIEEER